MGGGGPQAVGWGGCWGPGPPPQHSPDLLSLAASPGLFAVADGAGGAGGVPRLAAGDAAAGGVRGTPGAQPVSILAVGGCGCGRGGARGALWGGRRRILIWGLWGQTAVGWGGGATPSAPNVPIPHEMPPTHHTNLTPPKPSTKSPFFPDAPIHPKHPRWFHFSPISHPHSQHPPTIPSPTTPPSPPEVPNRPPSCHPPPHLSTPLTPLLCCATYSGLGSLKLGTSEYTMQNLRGGGRWDPACPNPPTPPDPPVPPPRPPYSPIFCRSPPRPVYSVRQPLKTEA